MIMVCTLLHTIAASMLWWNATMAEARNSVVYYGLMVSYDDLKQETLRGNLSKNDIL